MIVAVYRLQLYVILKISTAENFSRRPGATTFNSDVRLFFTQASGHNFQPCCGPVFKTSADSGPCGMLIAPLFFSVIFSSRPEGTSFSAVMGTYKSRAVPSDPCGMSEPQTVPLKKVLASCVVPVYCLSFGVQ